ncbi:hypothetical protein ACQSSU_14980 [Micromonospora echinospora]
MSGPVGTPGGKSTTPPFCAPVCLSANVPHGDAHDSELEARYAGRLRRGT